MALPTAETAPVTPKIKKQYRLLYRSDDGSAAYESVNDPGEYELLTVTADGTYLHRVYGVGFREIRREWEAATPFDKVLVPDDAGRKRWTHLDVTEDELVVGGHEPASEPDPIPEPELVPEPEPVRGMQPVPVAAGPDVTNLADIEGRSWGPGVRWLG
jgi:hypothetical protein